MAGDALANLEAQFTTANAFERRSFQWAMAQRPGNGTTGDAVEGVTSFYRADGLGSITTLTDSMGLLASSYVYDSFGNTTATSGTISNPFRYTGREWDAEIGLYYYRARYYDTSPAGLSAKTRLDLTAA